MSFIKHTRLFIAAFALLLGVGGMMVPAVALAATPKSTVCQALDSGTDCTTGSNNSVSLTKVVTAVINILSVVVGIAAVIMIVVGGFRFITSGGDSNNVASARNTVLYAIIGLVVVAMAQFIVQFVLHKV